MLDDSSILCVECVCMGKVVVYRKTCTLCVCVCVVCVLCVCVCVCCVCVGVGGGGEYQLVLSTHHPVDKHILCPNVCSNDV